MGGEMQHAWIVRHHHHRATAAVQLGEHLHDAVTAGAIQVPGGFIRQDQQRIVDQGAGDGHALLLPAGELGRFMATAFLQPHPFEQLCRVLTAFGCRDAVEAHGEGNILRRVHAGDQVEGLKDKSHRLAAVDRQGILIQRFQRLPVDRNMPEVARSRPPSR